MATQPGRHKQVSWIRWIIIVIAVLLFASSAVIWILQGIILGHLSTVVSIIFAVTGVIVALIQWLFPYSSNRIHDEAMVNGGRGSRTAIEELIGMPALSEVQVVKETPATGPIWNVPFRRNPFFTGREDLLDQLHDNLTRNKAAALTQAQAISGLGGIGKTQTAVEYAYRHRDEYRSVLWINAATRDALIANFVDLASLLHLPERQEQDQQKVVAAVKQWLSTHDQWLLIFDNADDLAVAEDLLPTGSNGHLLLTTRAYAPGTLANGIEVEKLDLQEGILLLLRRAGVLALDASLNQAPVSDRKAAAAIVEELGGLPLALDQAGAYIEETRCSVADYLQSYRKRQAALLKRRGGTDKYHPDSVATTWSLSFEQVEQLYPVAADLLRFCAFLAPDAIPEQLILEGASELSPRLKPLAGNPSLLDEAVGTLRHFSLVQRKRDERTISIHRLVQAVLRSSMDTPTQRQWAERTVRAVNQAFPDVTDYRNWPLCQQYLPHAGACATLTNTWEFAFPEAGSLLNRAGYYLNDRALYEEAEPLFQRSIAIGEKTLGPEHPNLATYLNNLAQLYQDQGKYAQAEPLFQRALAISEKALGPDHPFTAATLNNLAQLYQDQGKYAQAEPLFQRALAISEKALPPDHPEIATTLNNLAGLYRGQGQFGRAESLLKRALAIWEQALGPEHSETAMTLNSLAGLYQDQGQYAQAEPLYQRALTIWEQVVGPDHPSTATILNNLAQLYQDQGQYAQAEVLYQRALAIREQVLGPEHPETAITLHNLALLYQHQGRYEKAASLYQRALATYEKALPPDHPSTAASLNNLAELYRAQGQYEQAEPLYQRALAIYEKILGPDHPDTAATLNNLAQLYQRRGEYARAEPLYQQALAIKEKALPAEHPSIAITLHNLAQLRQQQGEYKQAEQYYLQALRIYSEFNDRYAQARTYHQLGMVAQEQRQFEQAEQYYQQALALFIEFNDRYEQASTYHQLGRVAQEQRQFPQARDSLLQALEIFVKFKDNHYLAVTLRSLARLWKESGDVDVPRAVAEKLGMEVSEAEKVLRQMVGDEGKEEA